MSNFIIEYFSHSRQAVKNQVNELRDLLREEDETNRKPSDVPIFGEGYVKSWKSPEFCRAHRGTCANKGFNYEEVTATTPVQNKVKRLCDINNPTADPWVTPLTSEELNENRQVLGTKVVAYNEKHDAPSPQINVRGVPVVSCIVVKKSNHTTYLYDKDGRVVKSIKNAVGRYGVDENGKSTETPVGVRYITGIAKTPYLGTDDTPKSKDNPEEYGPYIIKMRSVDEKTGNTKRSGIYLHGTKPEWYGALGTHASHGCVRHHNQVITDIVNSGLVNSGAFVNIIE